MKIKCNKQEEIRTNKEEVVTKDNTERKRVSNRLIG